MSVIVVIVVVVTEGGRQGRLIIVVLLLLGFVHFGVDCPVMIILVIHLSSPHFIWLRATMVGSAVYLAVRRELVLRFRGLGLH